jgi:hypothetical protein
MTTSLVVTTDNSLIKTVAPALPLAPVEYQKTYHDQVNSTLRLYFNQIDKLISQLSLRGNYTVATLPSAVTSGAGARAFVTDSSVSTFGTTIAAGGAINVPVYSDGTNWKVG